MESVLFQEHPPADKEKFPRWQYEGNKNEGWVDYTEDVQEQIRVQWDPELRDMTKDGTFLLDQGADWKYVLNIFTLEEAADHEIVQDLVKNREGSTIVGYQEHCGEHAKRRLIRVVLGQDGVGADFA